MTRQTDREPLWVSVLLDTNLTTAERVVLMGFCWHQGANGSSYPSQETLSRELGISERNVRRVIQSLIHKGRLRISRPANQGRGKANTYVVMPGGKGGQVRPPSGDEKADKGAPLSDEKGGQSAQERGAQMSSQLERKRRREKSAQISFDAATICFTGITDQLKARWLEAHPGIDVDRELVKAAIWWKDNPRRRRKDIPRFLSNWMNRAERGFPGRPVQAPFEDPTVEELDARLAKMGLP